jgi:hypothetical protein
MFCANTVSQQIKNRQICRQLGSKSKTALELPPAKMVVKQYFFNQKNESLGVWRMAKPN